MTTQIIPTPDSSTPFATQTTTLDGVPYILYFQYNQRENTWWLTVSTIDGTAIYGACKLVVNYAFLDQCVDARRPPGQLMVISNTSDLSPPGIDDLAPGGRCSLCYEPIADVEALLGGA